MSSRVFARWTALVVVGTVLISAASALGSATVYPAGNRFGLVFPPNPRLTSAIAGTCSLSQTPFGNVPATPGNTNPSGPVSLPVIPPAAAVSCPPGYGVSGTGSWALSVEWGAPAPSTFSIPAGGITLTNASMSCTATTTEPLVVRGGVWMNGISIYAPSMIGFGTTSASAPARWASSGGSCLYNGLTETFTLSNLGTVRIRDASGSAGLILVGP